MTPLGTHFIIASIQSLSPYIPTLCIYVGFYDGPLGWRSVAHAKAGWCRGKTLTLSFFDFYGALKMYLGIMEAQHRHTHAHTASKQHKPCGQHQFLIEASETRAEKWAKRETRNVQQLLEVQPDDEQILYKNCRVSTVYINIIFANYYAWVSAKSNMIFLLTKQLSRKSVFLLKNKKHFFYVSPEISHNVYKNTENTINRSNF